MWSVVHAAAQPVVQAALARPPTQWPMSRVAARVGMGYHKQAIKRLMPPFAMSCALTDTTVRSPPW